MKIKDEIFEVEIKGEWSGSGNEELGGDSYYRRGLERKQYLCGFLNLSSSNV